MKTILKSIMLLTIVLVAFGCSDDDDGSTTTGNTNEYFKYTIDGVERIFDYDIEAHLETDGTTIIDKYEINASGQQSSGDLRRIAAVFSFDSSGAFMPNTIYNWGLALDSNPAAKFYFGETTPSHIFGLSIDYTSNPIDATVTSVIPSNVGDYLEFTFTGTFLDNSNVVHNISGECRVQREVTQNY
ncbi:hypothetical protein [Lacinutrix mariniflava]|uniref:hypothetical protein n=1 Tax=Lacinutrix mariniflava TaxID=342955 RepID=UPI0006E3EFAC|nr:hypothetical protein [Lacinutrix mariniflava]